MRGNKKRQLVQDQRQAVEDERSAESKLRREKRKATGRAQEIAKAVKCSPAGRTAAETLKAKRGGAEERASELPEASSEIGNAIGGKKKTNPGSAARQDRRVRSVSTCQLLIG